MKNNTIRLVVLIGLALQLLMFAWPVSAAKPKGIYITQGTLEDTRYINYLIKRAKATGINTFVVDLEVPSKKYQQNIRLLKENNITYVARIVIYPDGGTPQQVASESLREKKYHLVKTAIGYGAAQIQLDYIRYNTKQPASAQNAINIHKIIQWYKERLAAQNIPLQVDVFGITSFGEEKHIGQSIKLFSQSVDVLCPMVYPSHYEPFPVHFAAPYDIVYRSLISIKKQFNNPLPFKLYPYIELSNYHYPLSREKKLKYIYAQIKATQDAGADGWYAWSPHNQYDNLFHVLETYPVK